MTFISDESCSYYITGFAHLVQIFSHSYVVAYVVAFATFLSSTSKMKSCDIVGIKVRINLLVLAKYAPTSRDLQKAHI